MIGRVLVITVHHSYKNGHLICRTITTKFGKNLEPFIPEQFKPLWHHPAGPQTIFFWAPIFKWGLVFAGLADLKRDPGTLSVKQTFSLAITGLIWSRYSVVIIPKNMLLFSVNMFVAITQCYQLYRIHKYNATLT